MMIQSFLVVLGAINAIVAAPTAISEGMAFNGGGFRAHACHTGTLAGLLAHIPGDSGNDKLQRFTQNVETFGSNSGGSWFFSQAAYSSSFLDMVHELSVSTDKQSAFDAYYYGWVLPYVTATNSLSNRTISDGLNTDIIDLFEKLWEVLAANFDILLDWGVLLYRNVVLHEVAWSEVVKDILGATGLKNGELPLREMVPNSWAQSKIWAIAANWATTTSSDAFTFGAYNVQCGANNGSFSYFVQTEKKYLPVTFSVRMGHPNEASPYSFVDNDYLRKLVTTVHEAPVNPDEAGIVFTNEKLWGKPISQIESNDVNMSEVWGHRTNEISLYDAVSTSSAFLGFTSAPTLISEYVLPLASVIKLFMDPADFMMKLFKFPMYFSASAEPSNAVSEAGKLCDPEGETCYKMTEDALNGRFMTLMDGGMIDNLGVAKLVGQGISTPFIFKSTTQNDVELDPTGWTDIYSLFQGAPHGSIYTHYPIFVEDYEYALGEARKFVQLEPQQDQEILNGVFFGTILATTTDQPYFGVRAGQQVELRIVVTSTSINLVSEDMKKYATLASEAQQTFLAPENRENVDEILTWIGSTSTPSSGSLERQKGLWTSFVVLFMLIVAQI